MTGWASPFHAFMVPVFGTLTILLVGLAVSALRGDRVAKHGHAVNPRKEGE
jgi:hypothetical protein